MSETVTTLITVDNDTTQASGVENFESDTMSMAFHQTVLQLSTTESCEVKTEPNSPKNAIEGVGSDAWKVLAESVDGVMKRIKGEENDAPGLVSTGDSEEGKEKKSWGDVIVSTTNGMCADVHRYACANVRVDFMKKEEITEGKEVPSSSEEGVVEKGVDDGIVKKEATWVNQISSQAESMCNAKPDVKESLTALTHQAQNFFSTGLSSLRHMTGVPSQEKAAEVNTPEAKVDVSTFTEMALNGDQDDATIATELMEQVKEERISKESSVVERITRQAKDAWTLVLEKHGNLFNSKDAWALFTEKQGSLLKSLKFWERTTTNDGTADVDKAVAESGEAGPSPLSPILEKSEK